MIESSLAGITETQLQQLIVIMGLLVYAYGVRPVVVYLYEWVSDHSREIANFMGLALIVAFFLMLFFTPPHFYNLSSKCRGELGPCTEREYEYGER